MTACSRSFHVCWGDLDGNPHRRTTASVDVGGDARAETAAQ